jgi:hypothetical protein
MKGNEISVKELSADSTEWLSKLHQTMIIKDYGKGSVRNYCQEMTLLFKYYNHKSGCRHKAGGYRAIHAVH